MSAIDNNRQPPLVLLAIAGFLVLFFQILAPEFYDEAVQTWDRLVSDVPEPLVVGVVTVGTVAVWIAMLVVVAKVLYWAWQQINDQVYYGWDLILPENPVVRFGAGVTVMLFLFVFGPLVVLQATDFFEDGDDDVEALDANETDDDTEVTPTPETNDSQRQLPRDDVFSHLGRETVG